jgi:hypothetical protein
MFVMVNPYIIEIVLDNLIVAQMLYHLLLCLLFLGFDSTHTHIYYLIGS